MNTRNGFRLAGVMVLLLPGWLAAAPAEKIRNEKVLVVEQTLAPGETLSLAGGTAGIVVYLDSGSVETTPVGGTSRSATVKRGDTVFQVSEAETLKNSGSSALRIVRTEYLGNGSSESWGKTGLAPHYTLLFENQYGRAYDIRIPAEMHEPLHTHHDRIVICLSGAELEHILPDGRKEISTLKTGEIAWRRGATHIGHNLGKTDLWVIAIEPK
jgi:hypothetical protein